MRRGVTFVSSGLRCGGWLYTPDTVAKEERAPAVVMAHGFSAVKEQGLAPFAERFVAAGLVTLVFDYRYFGASEGTPRGRLFPADQIEDYRIRCGWIAWPSSF